MSKENKDSSSDLVKLISELEEIKGDLKALSDSDSDMQKELERKRSEFADLHKANARKRRVLNARKENVLELLRPVMPPEVGGRSTASEIRAMYGAPYNPYVMFDNEGYFGK